MKKFLKELWDDLEESRLIFSFFILTLIICKILNWIKYY